MKIQKSALTINLEQEQQQQQLDYHFIGERGKLGDRIYNIWR